MGIQRLDHMAVRADIPLCVADIEETKRVKSSRNAMKSSRIASTGLIPWQVDVHTHATLLAQQISTHGSGTVWKRKTHLQDDTWTLIQWKRYHWKRCNQLRTTIGQSKMRLWFQAWKHVRRAGCIEGGASWFHQAHFQHAFHSYHLSRLAPLVAQRVKKDDIHFYKELSLQTARCAADEGLPHLWKVLKPMLPKATAKRKSNIRCIGPTVEAMSSHFNCLEAGQGGTYQELLNRCDQAQVQACQETPLTMSLEDIPTMIEMEQIVLRQKRNKAPGLDGVSASALQDAVRRDPRPYYDLIFKSWVTAAEPLQYKGGLVHCIAKKSGGREVTAMRGITLLDSFGKCYHALARSALLRWSTSRRIPTQFGGFARQQTLFATQYVRAFVRVAGRAKLSTAVLFIDVKSAFHCMLREHVFGTQDQFPPPLRRVLEEEGFNVAALESAITEHSADFVSTAKVATVRVLQDAHQSTWYTLPGHDVCYDTARGSRPGSPLADLAYNTLMTKVLQLLEEKLQSHPQFQQVAMHLSMTCLPVSWVDDVAIPLASTTPLLLDQLVVDATAMARDAFGEFGLRINMEKNKTEAVIQYRGQEAPQARLTRFVEQCGHLQLGTPFNGASLRVVSDYQHLGTNFAQGASIVREVRIRLGKASTVFRQLRKNIFANRKLPIATRLTLLESLVLSIVFHGSGNWPLLPYRLMKTLTHGVVAWQRSIIGIGHWSSSQVSDDELLSRWKQPTVVMRLAKFRILYGLQWYQQAPPILTQLVSAEDFDDDSWLAAVRHDLRWLSRFAPNLIPTPPESTADVFQWFHDHQQHGARQVRRAIGKAIQENHVVFEVVSLHRDIFQACTKMGVRFAPFQHEDHGLPQLYPCQHCDRMFSTAQALQGHQWKKHGQISQERRFVFSNTCLGCNRCFWTAQRLQQHLKATRAHVNGCYHWIAQHHEPLDEPKNVQVDRDLLRFQRLPTCVVSGPQHENILPLWRQRQEKRMANIREQWRQHGFPFNLDPAVSQVVKHAMTQTTSQMVCQDPAPTDWMEVWIRTLAEAVSDFRDDSVMWAFFEWGRMDMYPILDGLDDPDVIEQVELAFLEIAESHPMWQLLSDWDAVCQWQAPPAEQVLQIQPPKQSSGRHDREQIPYYLDQQGSLLQQWCGRAVLEKACPKGIPVVEGEDGSLTLYILHLFFRGGGALAIADLIFMKCGNSILGLRQSTWCSYPWTLQLMRRSGTWTPGTAGT